LTWLFTVVDILSKLLNVYWWILLIYILMSWVPNARYSTVGQWMARICEPFLEPFRRIIPPIGGVIDISPWAAFLVLYLANIGLRQLPWLLMG
jgi:YggT family protein